MAFKLFLVLAAVSYVNGISFLNGTSSRLINSPIATDSQFPYVISLQRITELPNQVQAHQCGGALITLQHSLTLAHCVTNVVNNVLQVRPANEYRVYAGGALLSAENANRVRNVANFTVHPEFVAYPSHINDIAIITTLQPFLNTTVTPIPLPSASFIAADWTTCNLAGWGAPNTSVLASNELRYTTKFIYNSDRCRDLWNANSTTTNIFPSMICAASYNIISSGCSGDQGNALICNGQLTGLLFLTNSCQFSSHPEVYTRVGNYTSWIRTISGASTMFRPELGVLAFIAVVCVKLFS